MQKIIIIFFLFSFYYSNIQSQNTSTLVKFKDTKTEVVLGTHNYWFDNEKYVSNTTPNHRAIWMCGFPVLIGDKMTTQNDTTLYNKEFNEHIADMQQSKNKDIKSITQKHYNSNIIQQTSYMRFNKKNYIVIDTVEAMNSWEISTDTFTVCGYLCQKASIVYKNIQYYAWFTPKLAYNSGPNGFSGLPGLILKVYCPADYKLGFEAIEIQIPPKEEAPVFNTNGETISKSKWLVLIKENIKKTKEAMNNMLNEYKKQGAIIHQ